MEQATKICSVSDLIPSTGICALVDGEQVAIFYESGELYALANYDPFSDANVISRGIVGDVKGKPMVSSPVYKQHFCLATGVCLEDDSVALKTYAVSAVDGVVYIAS